MSRELRRSERDVKHVFHPYLAAAGGAIQANVFTDLGFIVTTKTLNAEAGFVESAQNELVNHEAQQRRGPKRKPTRSIKASIMLIKLGGK